MLILSTWGLLTRAADRARKMRDALSLPPASVTHATPPLRPPRTRRTRSSAPPRGAPPQRRAFGATSRVPDQSLPALTVDVCDSPAVGAASPTSLGSTWPARPDLGVSSHM